MTNHFEHLLNNPDCFSYIIKDVTNNKIIGSYNPYAIYSAASVCKIFIALLFLLKYKNPSKLIIKHIEKMIKYSNNSSTYYLDSFLTNSDEIQFKNMYYKGDKNMELCNLRIIDEKYNYENIEEAYLKYKKNNNKNINAKIKELILFNSNTKNAFYILYFKDFDKVKYFDAKTNKYIKYGKSNETRISCNSYIKIFEDIISGRFGPKITDIMKSAMLNYKSPIHKIYKTELNIINIIGKGGAYRFYRHEAFSFKKNNKEYIIVLLSRSTINNPYGIPKKTLKNFLLFLFKHKLKIERKIKIRLTKIDDEIIIGKYLINNISKKNQKFIAKNNNVIMGNKIKKQFLLYFNKNYKIFNKYYGNLLITAKDNKLIYNLITDETYYLNSVLYTQNPLKFLLKKEYCISFIITSKTYLNKIIEETGFIYDNGTDQHFSGYDIAYTKKYILAVNNIILTYNFKLINIFYGSTCGGITNKNLDLKYKRYHKQVNDIYNNKILCKNSPYFNWKVKFHLRHPINSISYNNSHLIKSPNFKINKNKENIIIKGYGLGHCHGLCQYGAYSLAKEKDWKYILNFYFPKLNISPNIIYG